MTHSDTGSHSPERVADLVGSLASVMCQAGVTELDLALGDVTIRLRRPALSDFPPAVPRSDVDARFDPPARPATHVISAPMVGTFYTASTPGAAPFVAVGDEIIAGQTIGIIEAMKIMNEIAADRGGIVEELLATNGQPVEYGSPLMRLLASEKP